MTNNMCICDCAGNRDNTSVVDGAVVASKEMSNIMNGFLSKWKATVMCLLREPGPIFLLALLMPGGSVVAGLLWLYHNHQKHGRTQ